MRNVTEWKPGASPQRWIDPGFPVARGRVGKHTKEAHVAMLVTTTLTVDGYRIKEYKGVVRGITVRSPTISQGIIGGLKNIIGGQIGAYTEMCEQARSHAYDLLIH
jgi:hypothetical protein